ncbi:cell division protein FtsA [Haemophilus paracuniculus]|uniref:Cell division protein FtsA n=1 Tax=Haemophilus paracuniculus TaxID=734 RepID=A0A1T0AQI0_9PAST|nr:cell division protein FtsA [Haemophilus paracuniculus]OOR98445.1 cell division protein FtsA [Haemophilus paracuniculus]
MSEEVAKSELICSLEIGTSKIVVVVSEVLPDGVVNVLGVGMSPAKGVEQGGITDFEAVVKSVQRAIEQAEMSSNHDIYNMVLSISGRHVRSFSRVMVDDLITGEVSEDSMQRIVEKARNIPLEENEEILHILPQEYWVDNLLPTKTPLGQVGMRLYSNVHIIVCNSTWKKNLSNVVSACKRNVVKRPVFSGLASEYSVLTEEEKERGVCLIDFGGGTMDVLVYTGGFLRDSYSYPYAGTQITNHISERFNTTFSEAENIKVKYGSAVSPPLFNADKKIEVAGLGSHIPRVITRGQLSELTSVCYNHFFHFVHQRLEQVRNDLKMRNINSELISGIVLTGGSSQIEDIVECAKSVFGPQVRVGYPQNITGLTDYVNKPQYATVLGLQQFGFHNKFFEDKPVIENPTLQKLFETVKNGIKGFIKGV